jgi:outer membrane protein OmpU
MNKMKKIGLTALATSLVASSAFAGEATVSGSVGYTWATTGGNTGTPGNDHGKGFGTDNSLAFNYSGDLDNGWSVSGYTTLQDAFSLTSSAVTLTMGDMGSIVSGSGWGGVSASFDEEIPHAYEQADDGSATSTSMNLVGSKNDNGGIQYKAPTIEMAGATVALQLGYTPKATDSHTTGGAVLTSDTFGSGQDAGVTISHESGLTLGVYASERSRVLVSSTATDEFTGTWYAKYAMGPVTIGYQESYYDPGLAPASDGTAANTAKTLGTTGSGIFTAEGYSIAFNVNDDLSVSYAKVEDTYDAQAGWTSGAVTGDKVADVSLDIKSIQAAYSMGSMSVKMYRTESDNNSYITNGGSRTKNEIALGISF